MIVINDAGSRPIKSWVELKDGKPNIEDSALIQLKNLARLPFIASNGIAAMSDVHSGKGSTVGSVIATHKAVIPAAVGVDIGCFTGDTLVKLADGRSLSFDDLVAEHQMGITNYVYSVTNGSVAIAKVADAKKTRDVTQLAEVTLDNGEVINCTIDHQFMTRSGEYVEAKNLTENISLMPHYHSISTTENLGDVGNANSESLGYKRVASVQIVECESTPVYCLTVPEFGNFALAAGVIVKNCGMQAVRTSLKASDLPESLLATRLQIERDVPMGPGGSNGRILEVEENWVGKDELLNRMTALIAKHPKIAQRDGAFMGQLGSLGGGNHFIELVIDESQDVWVMLHSGSRGFGNKVGSFFIEQAMELMEQYFITLTDRDLAYLPEGTALFADYIEAVAIAQEYAFNNRAVMLKRVFSALQKTISKPFTLTDEAISCHHNYLAQESHFGQNLWVTRKGAIQARSGTLGIIPGSMGQKSFIVRGKGNAESYHSCSHGAGRMYSRTKARQLFNIADLEAQTQGVECRKDDAVLDEIPSAYKPIDQVMANQTDLVEVVHELKAVLCVKGN